MALKAKHGNFKKIFLIPLFFLTSHASAEVVEKFEYASYKAIANPNRPLYESLNSASPIRHNGEVFHGYTEWNILWQYQLSEDGTGECRITKITTNIQTVITLPTLAGGSAIQQNKFLKYYTALKEHELGHYYYGKTAATEIDRQLTRLPKMANCKILENTANNLGNQIIDSYKKKDNQYDVTTGHGKTQGAYLED